METTTQQSQMGGTGELMPELGKVPVMTEPQQTMHQGLQKEGFLPITLDCYPLLKQYEGENCLQMRCLEITTVWACEIHALHKVIDDCLCTVVFMKSHGEYFLIFPKHGQEKSLQPVIDSLYDAALKAGFSRLYISGIEKRSLKNYTDIKKYKIEMGYNEVEHEYAYTIENLLCMDGAVNYYKRKRIKRYLEKKEIRLEIMTSKNAACCIDIIKKWCAAKSKEECDYCYSFYGCEKNVTRQIVRLFPESDLTGLIGFDGDEPIGYIITQQHNKNVSQLCHGKGADNDFFVFLIYMFYKNYMQGPAYMNFGDNMGSMSLKFFKYKLSSSELWPVYFCSFTKIVP
ncbi:MAG: hypothetical protein Ta2G_09920 [Termitinemataceae bacterium]|nr:MAG: hypothetical protein Ta2G_09920 [Termitinemataceae bacterium]